MNYLISRFSAFFKNKAVANADRQTPQAPPAAPNSQAVALVQAAIITVSTVLKTMLNHGLEVAREAGDLVLNPIRRSILHNYAAAVVVNLFKGPFDPINNADDATIQEEIDEVKARGRKAEADLIRLTATANEAKRNVPAAEPSPRPSMLVIFFAVIGFMVAFGTSIYELPLMRLIEDDLQALAVSGLIGAALGGLCVASMFGLQIHNDETSAVWSPKLENGFPQMIAGVLMILAFALVRTFAATGPRDWLITAGLSSLDAGVLLYAKGEAARHRMRETAWAQRCDARHQKLLLAEVTSKQREDVRVELESARTALAAARARLAARMELNFDLDEMKEAVISAIDEGYSKGVDENNGRLAA